MITLTHFHGMSKEDIKLKIKESRHDSRMYERWISINCSMEGFTIPQIALMLNRNENTIREWISNFNTDGAEGLFRDSPQGKKKDFPINR